MTTLTAYCRTLRHLRWSQLFWRARYSWERRCRTPRSAAFGAWTGTEPPRLRDDVPVLPLFHCPSPGGPEAVALLREGIFRHLHQERTLGRRQPDWRLGPQATERLWTITLHYHAWTYALAAAGTEEAADLFCHYLGDWMTRCSLAAPGARALAWNSYAIATRLCWWLRAYQTLEEVWWQKRPAFRRAFLESMWQQAAYLYGHLEWDLRGNHLLRDAVGLATAGSFFAEQPARHWLAAATRLALQQVHEQVLPDGGHFERSPMYHVHVMEDVFSLAMLVEDAAARDQLRAAWRRMAEYLAWMRHPDGDIPLLNDGALQAACAPELMLRLGSWLDAPLAVDFRRGGRYFADSGILVWHGQPWTIFFDVGAVGPDYQPGHGHADTLTVECSYQGQRLFVDPGTYGYDRDERRRYERSTEAHNTVCIDGQDSSEVWHIFRVGRRAYPVAVRAECSDVGLTAEASHTGYDHLLGRPRHQRTLTVAASELTLSDRIAGGGRHVVQGGFLLAPAWKAAKAGGGWVLTNGPHRVRLTVRGPDGLTLFAEPRPYYPRYGEEISTQRLGWRVEGTLPLEVLVRVEGM